MSWVDDKANWLKISLTCDGEIAEVVAEILGRYVEEGVAIESITVFDTDDYEFKSTGNVKVIGYIRSNEDTESKKAKFEEALWHLNQIVPIPKAQYEFIEDEDWMAKWKQNYRPIEIGEKILIVPSWIEEINNNNRIIIRIDPAMAFGTGTHPSTQLCLQAIEDYLLEGVEIIDLGCGSGILSVAGLLLGARYALAVDTDKQSVLATRKNAELNHVSPHLHVFNGSLAEIIKENYPISKASFVVANILAPVIIRLLSEGLADLKTKDGYIVLAGILDHQKIEVLNACENVGLALTKEYKNGDWIALVLK